MIAESVPANSLLNSGVGAKPAKLRIVGASATIIPAYVFVPFGNITIGGNDILYYTPSLFFSRSYSLEINNRISGDRGRRSALASDLRRASGVWVVFGSKDFAFDKLK